MSVVVAIKDKDRVYMACDCQGSISALGYKSYYTNPLNYKVWKYPKVKGILMGGVGDAYTSELIRTGSYFRGMSGEDVSIQWLIQQFMFNLLEDLNNFGKMECTTNGDVYIAGSAYFIATNNKIYSLDGDSMFFYEESDYCATGSGMEAALGSLESSKGEPIKVRLIKAVDAARKLDLYVNGPIIIMNTLNDETLIIDDAQKEIDKISAELNNGIKKEVESILSNEL